jgi:hypothetical protein
MLWKPRHEPPDLSKLAVSDADEAEAVAILQGCLRDLNTFTGQFFDALLLFQHCLDQGNRPQEEVDIPLDELRSFMRAWLKVAARDGGMSIWHYSKALDGACDLWHCPSLRPLIDAKALRIARRLFIARFPQFALMRHSIAHTAELTSSRDRRRANALLGEHKFGFHATIHGSGPGAMIRNHLYGRHFVNSIDQQLVSYEVSEEALAKLVDITDRVFAAFPLATRSTPPAPRGSG